MHTWECIETIVCNKRVSFKVGGSELLIIGRIVQSGNGSLLCLKESIRKCPLKKYSCSLEASKVKKDPGKKWGLVKSRKQLAEEGSSGEVRVLETSLMPNDRGKRCLGMQFGFPAK